jgi:hypothetical protein
MGIKKTIPNISCRAQPVNRGDNSRIKTNSRKESKKIINFLRDGKKVSFIFSAVEKSVFMRDFKVLPKINIL